MNTNRQPSLAMYV